MRYIGFWPRVLAQFIDNTLATLLMAPVIFAYGWEYFNPQRTKGFSEIMYGTVLPITALYLMWRYFQTSPGKYLIRSRIADADTLSRPTSTQLLIRMVGYVPCILSLGVGFMGLFTDPRRQGWHDTMAGTVVVADSTVPEDKGFKILTRPPPPRDLED